MKILLILSLALVCLASVSFAAPAADTKFGLTEAELGDLYRMWVPTVPAGDDKSFQAFVNWMDESDNEDDKEDVAVQDGTQLWRSVIEWTEKILLRSREKDRPKKEYVADEQQLAEFQRSIDEEQPQINRQEVATDFGLTAAELEELYRLWVPKVPADEDTSFQAFINWIKKNDELQDNGAPRVDDENAEQSKENVKSESQSDSVAEAEETKEKEETVEQEETAEEKETADQKEPENTDETDQENEEKRSAWLVPRPRPRPMPRPIPRPKPRPYPRLRTIDEEVQRSVDEEQSQIDQQEFDKAQDKRETDVEDVEQEPDSDSNSYKAVDVPVEDGDQTQIDRLVRGLVNDWWTRKRSGCSCYFDKTSTRCACCRLGGCQCSRSNLHQCVQCGRGWMCGRSSEKREVEEEEKEIPVKETESSDTST